MLVDINKIIIKDRIRKDFGDIEELAKDIKENGLINPPVVNKEYELLAGERRFRACKSLGWNQIPVTMMDTRDAEHELNIEISENDVRKDFTKSERVDYMKRLFRIEEAKAKERQGNKTSVENNTEVKRADEETARQFDISASTMRKEITIADHKDLLDPKDFADWDEGKLSTNKAFMKIKHELDKTKADLTIAQNEANVLRNRPPKEITKEVIKFPSDYEKLKNETESIKQTNNRLDKERKEYLDRANAAEKRIKELENRESETAKTLRRESQGELFIIRTRDYLESVASLIWIFEEFDEVWDEKTKVKFKKAVTELNGYAQQMMKNVGG